MWWLLLGYLFLYIHRPFEVWPSLGVFRIELLYMLLAGSLWVAAGNKRWLPSAFHWAFAFFAIVTILCWLASPWNHVYTPDVPNYLKLFPCYLLIVTICTDEEKLKRLMLGFLMIMFIYLTHSLFEYINGRHAFRMGIVRLIGVDLSHGDPNWFGASIVYTLPFIVPLWIAYKTTWVRLFLVSYLGLSTICIGLTGSRSSFIGLILCMGVLIYRSRWRLPCGIMAFALAPLLWFALPSSLQTRFETIVDPDVGPKNAQESAQGRLEGLFTGLELWEAYPVTGCGPGLWIPATGSKIQPHNLYGQVVGEMGTLGLVAFGAVLLCYWIYLRRIRYLYKIHPEWQYDFLYAMANAIGLALLLLLFFGNFSHSLLRFNWVWYAGFLIVVHHCVISRLATDPLAGVQLADVDLPFDYRAIPAIHYPHFQ